MERKEILKEIKKQFSAEELDEYVYEKKEHEASVINNEGIDAQLKYLDKTSGDSWLSKLLATR